MLFTIASITINNVRITLTEEVKDLYTENCMTKQIEEDTNK